MTDASTHPFMADASTGEARTALPAAAELLQPRFRRQWRGYRRSQVKTWMADVSDAVADLAQRLDDARNHIEHLQSQLGAANTELRFWHDRQSFADATLERSRIEAADIERHARERALELERDARSQGLRIIDRVTAQANAMLEHARSVSTGIMERTDTESRRVRQEIEHLEHLRFGTIRSMQAALQQFERGLFEIDHSQRRAAPPDLIRQPSRAKTLPVGSSQAPVVQRPGEQEPATATLRLISGHDATPGTLTVEALQAPEPPIEAMQTPTPSESMERS